jgi:hypothetical protein
MAAAGSGAAAPHDVGLINSLHEFTWRLDGLTMASFTGASVIARLYSPPFRACDFEWRLFLAPNGRRVEEKGHVGVYCLLLTANATTQPTVSFVVGRTKQRSLDDDIVFSTYAARPEGAKPLWGFTTCCRTRSWQPT